MRNAAVYRGMQCGYGYNRAPAALKAAGADRLWIDHDQSGREMRAHLFGPQGLRPGDVLILLDRGDLGVGKEIARFEAMAIAAGAAIQIVEAKPPTRLAPGRKPGFAPTQEQEALCRHWWMGPFRRADALDEIEKIMGRRVSPDQLNRRIGLRGGGKLK